MNSKKQLTLQNLDVHSKQNQTLGEIIIRTHIYGQCSQEEFNDCIKKTIAAHNKIQGETQKAQKGD